MCEVKKYYATAANCENHRADAIVFEESDPWHPWFIDFVQAQIDDPDERNIMRHINAAYQAKISELLRDHLLIPRTSIIPFAFCSNGLIHPQSLLFIDWFLCRASHAPINEPSAIEKLRVLHAISGAIVDQTATLVTSHFNRFIYSLYDKEFPVVLSGARGSLSTRQGRRLVHPRCGGRSAGLDSAPLGLRTHVVSNGESSFPGDAAPGVALSAGPSRSSERVRQRDRVRLEAARQAQAV